MGWDYSRDPRASADALFCPVQATAQMCTVAAAAAATSAAVQQSREMITREQTSSNSNEKLSCTKNMTDPPPSPAVLNKQ